jgi:iron(III) transport system permease protein
MNDKKHLPRVTHHATLHAQGGTRRAGFVLAIWFVLAGLPVLLLAGHTLIRLASGDLPRPLALVIPSGRRLPLFGKTVGFALAVALPGTLIGLLGAGAVYTSASARLRRLTRILLPMAVIPPYIHALAWGGLLRGLNRTLAAAGMARLPEQGFVPSLWVQMMALLPFVFGILHLGFSCLPAESVNAARLLGADARAARRVILPMLAPWLAVACLFQFLVSLLDDSVPSLFQFNLYPLTIFSEYSIRYDAAHAMLLSLPVLAISLPAVRLLMAALRNLPLTGSGQTGSDPRWRLPAPLRIATALGLALCLLQIFLPLGSLLAQALPSFSDPRWLADALPDLGGTLAVGLLSAGITLPVAWTAADAIHTRRTGHPVWWWLMLVPLALPAPLIGVGLIHTWNAPALSWLGLYNTSVMPALASTLRFLPFSAMLLLAAMKRQHPGQLDAVRLLQRSTLHGLFTVRLPLLRGALLGAGLLAAVLSFAELGATLLLLPPGAGSLTIRIYNYLHYGQSDVIAGLCLVLYVVALGLGVGFARLLARGQDAAPGEAAPPDTIT